MALPGGEEPGYDCIRFLEGVLGWRLTPWQKSAYLDVLDGTAEGKKWVQGLMAWQMAVRSW